MSEQDKWRSDDFRYVQLGADYGCPHCDNVFALPARLIAHIKAEHPEARGVSP